MRDVVFGRNRRAAWNKLMAIEHGSAVTPGFEFCRGRCAAERFIASA